MKYRWGKTRETLSAFQLHLQSSRKKKRGDKDQQQ